VSPETSWHMSKAQQLPTRGGLSAWPWWESSNNPVIAAHYARKRAAGKSPMNALATVCAKP